MSESAIPRAVLRTQFTRKFGLRVIGEYRIQRFFQREGSLYDQYETMVLDVLGSYLLYPNQSVLVGGRLMRRPARQHFVKDCTKRIDIRSSRFRFA